MFDIKNPADYATELGQKLKALRLQRNLRQSDVAHDAGISAPTLGVLENQGRGSLEVLAKVMYVLGREGELDRLLPPDPPTSLDEIGRVHARKRARR